MSAANPIKGRAARRQTPGAVAETSGYTECPPEKRTAKGVSESARAEPTVRGAAGGASVLE
jgi:hypothetical protein